jgi:hypothetical protein
VVLIFEHLNGRAVESPITPFDRLPGLGPDGVTRLAGEIDQRPREQHAEQHEACHHRDQAAETKRGIRQHDADRQPECDAPD